jgi:hypothetical protein
MIVEPLNDEDCLSQATAHAVAAMQREDVRELAARLGSIEAVVRYLRRLPQTDDGPDDWTPGERITCDVPQRARVPASSPNCFERAILYLALAELIDPRRLRCLMTIELGKNERHTFPVEEWEPVVLNPDRAPRNALAAGVHLVRNARGDRGAPLSSVDALSWAVHLVGDVASQSATWAVRHRRALEDVARVAQGAVPKDPATLAWALKLAAPEAIAFGPEGEVALLAASALLDQLASGKPAHS